MTSEPDGFLVCLVSAPREAAQRLARLLVERGIAACVNRVPVASTYRWQGAVEEASEDLLVVKTARARLPELEAALASDHPYTVPELVALAPAAVGGAYAAWWAAAIGPEIGG